MTCQLPKPPKYLITRDKITGTPGTKQAVDKCLWDERKHVLCNTQIKRLFSDGWQNRILIPCFSPGLRLQFLLDRPTRYTNFL